MRLRTTILLTVAAIALSGCAAPQQRPNKATASAPARAPHTFKPIEFKYDAKSAAALNFTRQLDLPAWQCDLEATTGATAVRYGNQSMITEYSNSLLECVRHSRAQGDEAIARLKAAKISAKQAELSKDLYAKWSTYLMTMSPYQPTDQRAKATYQAAKEALATEVKFAE
jgi:hypothetical protein